jgi:uncharacterized protein YjbI with pentapeptide repeats
VGALMIEKLLNSEGCFRMLLGLPTGVVVDLSAMGWEQHYAVIKGILLDNAKISSTNIVTNFVECSIKSCDFSAITTDGHFSGAGNQWTDCRFINCKFSDMIAPQSRFERCYFENNKIIGLRLCHTVFNDCIFRNVTIQAMSTRNVGSKSLQLPETVAKGATGLFRKCRFEKSCFLGCKFNDVCFEDCTVENVQFPSCNFQDVISQDHWVREIKSNDTFLAFIDALIAGITRKIGGNSDSVLALEKYKNDYINQKTISKDYSAVLYSGSVQDHELDVIESIIETISSEYAI